MKSAIAVVGAIAFAALIIIGGFLIDKRSKALQAVAPDGDPPKPAKLDDASESLTVTAKVISEPVVPVAPPIPPAPPLPPKSEASPTPATPLAAPAPSVPPEPPSKRRGLGWSRAAIERKWGQDRGWYWDTNEGRKDAPVAKNRKQPGVKYQLLGPADNITEFVAYAEVYLVDSDLENSAKLAIACAIAAEVGGMDMGNLATWAAECRRQILSTKERSGSRTISGQHSKATYIEIAAHGGSIVLISISANPEN